MRGGRGTIVRIGIVEDDTVMAWLLEEVCRTSGHQIVGTAPAAGEAIPLLERERPDCLLLDYMLDGDRDGLELLRQAKGILPSLFTIMITAWDVNDIAGRMGVIQPDRILRKPIHTDTLVTILNGAGQRRVFGGTAHRVALPAYDFHFRPNFA